VRDALIDDLFNFHHERHEEVGHISDMPALARAFGTTYQIAENSFMTPNGIINVSASGGLRQRRALAAHEISHALTYEQDEEGDSYEKALRYHHASVPDIEAHLEALADHGGDRLLMPDFMVRRVLQEWGYSGQAVWELRMVANVTLREALRRIVYFDPLVRIGGFVVGSDSEVYEAASQGLRIPVWLGDEVAYPLELIDEGLSVFEISGQPGSYICLKKLDDFEAA